MKTISGTVWPFAIVFKTCFASFDLSFLNSSLPGSIGKLKCLVALDMSYNQLEHLPPELGQCVKLNSVDLQHNKLVDLPEEIGQLINLVRLGLR